MGSLIGQPVGRIEGPGKVTGRAIYPADITFPGMLYGKARRIPVASARIDKVDVEAARKIPGVVAVLTAKDVPGHNGHGVLIPHMPVLVADRVRSVNDVVAVVAAESEEAAEEAAEAIKVEYEPLPAVFDPLEAMKPGAPLVHEDGNILYHIKIRRGNIDVGRKEAAAIVTRTYRTAMMEHAFLQPEAAVARVDERGHIEIHVATQYPHWDRVEVARALGLPETRVRIITTAVGGAFGAREDMTLQILAALLAWHTGRPVKMVNTREESFYSHSKRHPMIMKYSTGADREGRLTFVEAEIIGDSGAYASWSPNVLRKAAVHATGPYYVPHVKIDAYAVYTNNPFTGAMRGFGATQPPLAYEAQMDLLAAELGLHPFTIRWRNILRQGDVTATGQVLESSVGLEACLLAAARAAGWDVERLK
ncbi:xanthine dehydrogenase family protein molybdopterin-binding subunit [Thermanaeromonas sp.]|uniref:xanthine dehydrogenase family protein molybdopterin-binding subunit n=1 Tax=Thermanaeromonas sp. TaxID=2003697 RepID=UPI0026278EA4|nr:molybdopterin cofactor-binding domain-containing protein [Thermanaeromonas sp.]